jgi:hypothetical protein
MHLLYVGTGLSISASGNAATCLQDLSKPSPLKASRKTTSRDPTIELYIRMYVYILCVYIYMSFMNDLGGAYSTCMA